jgi:hypothetical protein
METIDVFVLANVPQHLAINNERPNEEKESRSVCGKSTAGMTVNNVPLPVVLACPDCQWQLEKWLKRAENHPDYDD